MHRSRLQSVLLMMLAVWCCVSFVSAARGGEPLREATAELVTLRSDFGLADGPAWDGQSSLYLPDVKGEKLYRYWPAQDKWQELLPAAGRVSATFYQLGKLYLSDNGNSCIAVLEGKELKTVYQHDPEAKPAARPNDLVVDHHGGVYYTLTARGEVCYIPAGTRESHVVARVETPNGLILSPDESRMYVAAYVPKEIWEFRLTAPGETAAGRVLARMDSGPEKGADGMCTDRAGNIYCCGPEHVWIWNSQGELLDKIVTPSRPINCAFGGAQMQTLYITGLQGVYSLPMLISGRAPHPSPVDEATGSAAPRPSTALPEGITARLDVVYAEYGARKLLADLLIPAAGDRQRMPAIVLVHGGGWVHGDKTKFRALAIELARKGYVTMAIEYRLAGEAKFPAAVHDCNAAVRYMRAQAEELGIDPNRIGMVGGSAGGHLAGLVATGYDHPELQGSGGWQEYSSRPNAVVVMAGPLEIATGPVAERSRGASRGSFAQAWFGKGIDELPEMYRLADACQKISPGDPPLLFLVGELDHPERNEASRQKYRDLGLETGVVVYPQAKHGCWNQLPWIHQFANDIDVFFRKHR